jgi:hypothetical protein
LRERCPRNRLKTKQYPTFCPGGGPFQSARAFGMETDAKKRTRRRQLGAYWSVAGKAKWKFRFKGWGTDSPPRPAFPPTMESFSVPACGFHPRRVLSSAVGSAAGLGRWADRAQFEDRFHRSAAITGSKYSPAEPEGSTWICKQIATGLHEEAIMKNLSSKIMYMRAGAKIDHRTPRKRCDVAV